MSKPLCLNGCISWWLWIIIVLQGALLITIIIMLLQWLRARCVTTFAAIFRNILIKYIKASFLYDSVCYLRIYLPMKHMIKRLHHCVWAHKGITLQNSSHDDHTPFFFLLSCHCVSSLVVPMSASNKIPGEFNDLTICQTFCPSKDRTWQMCAVWVSVQTITKWYYSMWCYGRGSNKSWCASARLSLSYTLCHIVTDFLVDAATWTKFHYTKQSQSSVFPWGYFNNIEIYTYY